MSARSSAYLPTSKATDVLQFEDKDLMRRHCGTGDIRLLIRPMSKGKIWAAAINAAIPFAKRSSIIFGMGLAGTGKASLATA